MTLALYGKSRRRQLTLLAIALFAVLAAIAGGSQLFRPFDASADSDNGYAATSSGEWADDANLIGSNTATFATTDDNGSDQRLGGFGITVPAGAAIDGIEVEVYGYTTGATCQLSASLREEVGPADNSTAKVQTLPQDTAGAVTYGGPSDLWGETWSIAELADGDFFVDLSSLSSDGCDTSGSSTDDWFLAYVKVTVYYTPLVDTDDDGVADGSDQCPNTGAGEAVNADGCSVQDYVEQLTAGTSSQIPDGVCAAADFNFIVDISGSVDSTEMTAVKNAMTGFATNYQGGGGAGLYAITTFGNGTATNRTAGFVNQTGFNTGIAAIPASGTGFTPTSLGISTGLANNANDRAGVGNIMFIITDGSPNQPDGGLPTSDPDRWVSAANLAIGQANTARGTYHVIAAYVGSPDPLLDTAMGSPANATLFAEAVMTELGGGSFIPSTFASLANDLLIESGCEPDPGQLTIAKYVWDGDSWNSTTSTDYDFLADGATDYNFNGPGTQAVTADTYTVTETALPAGTHLVGLYEAASDTACLSAPPQGTVADAAAQSVSVTVPVAGHKYVCAFNAPNPPTTGNIYLDKVAANADPAGTEFALLINGVVKANNSHAEGFEGPFSTAAGTVVVQEELLAGYEYGGVVCRLGAADGTAVTTAVDNSGGANRRGVSFTLAADTNVYCQFTNRLLPPPEITINAYKIVCDAEADLPNWGDGGANITATTAATFVDASGGDCRFVNGWAFEWSDGDVVNTSPGDNLNDTALADFTTTTSASDNTVPTGQTPASVTINISQYDKLWVREKKPAGYLNFSSDTTAPRDNVSAEFYCSADVINYDNWERIENTSGAHDLTAGTTYNCVAFNVDVRPGFIEVHKVVTNVVDDPTAFDFSFANPATNFTVVETDANGETRSANIGAQVVTEAPEAGYNTLGWARINGGTTCPAAMPTQVSGNVIEFGTDNTAEITIAPNNTTVLCFYNELDRGDITIEKYVWDGDSWEPHVAPAPFTFDINPIANIVPVHDNVGPGTYQVPAGEYAVIENLPVSGYEFQAIFEGDEVCPDSPFPNEPTQVLTDPFVNVEVPGGGDVLVCAYNLPVGRLIINKVNTTDDGPFTFDIDLDGGNFDTAVGGAAAGLTEVYNEVVPLGEYTVTELGVGVFDQCPTAPGVEQIFQLNPTPVQSLTAPGQTITFTIINEECPVIFGTGTLVVEKYLDLNGIPGAEDTPLNWTVTVTGPEFPGGQAFLLDGTGDSPSVGVLVLPGIATGAYTVTEATPSSYVQTGLFVNGIDMGINATAGVVVTLNETETVEFYNQPTGTVRVEKSTFVNGVAVDDRGGWTITVAGCGYFAAGVTNASGVVIFDDVPACANVTVQEDPNSKPGYTPTSGAAKVVSVTPNNTTVVTFRNEKNPPCIDCGPTPTPSTPTSTPTATPSATPTGTQPAGETPTPTPTESVAGEITPGTGAEATPIPPAAGTGTAGATSAIAMMLVVLGLFAISSGTTILAVARRRK